MVKLSISLTRRPDLTRDAFRDHRTDRHAPLARDLPEARAYVRRCVQQRAIEGLPDGLPLAPYDGTAEAWFDDLGSALAALRSENYATVVAQDEERFLDRSKTAMTITTETLGLWPDRA